MSFPCPYCQHDIHPKAPRPGRYKPKCPKCQKQFQLTIADDGSAQAEALRADPAATVRMAPPGPPAKSETAGARTAEPAATNAVTELNRNLTALPATADATMAPASPAADATGVFKNDNETGEATAIQPAPTRIGLSANDDASFDVSIPDPPTKADPKNKKSRSKAAELNVPESLGGYRIIRELGRGGMGAVYLAQQLSLDRAVALKVMNPAWSHDAAFVARFMREAYAAAQLTHHNVVQIYDFGKDHGAHYFSMEFVDGQSLGDLVKKDGKVDVELAVGYGLQAARGLKYAHERGMIHRDIKPDNLMLNSQGIVKVADLGLVKTPGVVDNLEGPAPRDKVSKGSKLADDSITDVTRVGIAMGTPAYMAPEQARNASGVDQRADIYSLGCTLYVLLTGRPPFQGSTVMEILSKHATAPLVPPEVLVKRVPKELSALLQKMVAKKPEDRFADMGEVARALEEWLGLKGEGGGNLSEEQATRLEDSVRQFNGATLAKFRTPARVAVAGSGVVLAFLLLLAGSLKLSLGAFCFSAIALLTSFVIGGIFRPSPLFSKVREYVFGMRWTAWLRAALALLLLGIVLVMFNLVWVSLLATLLGMAAGAGLYFGLDRTVDSQRVPALEAAEELFKQLRLRGMDEEELRHFACKYGGNNWEEFYEELFGYEEMLKARDWWVRGQKGQARQKHAPWREPLIAAIERRIAARRETAERRLLQRVEEERLIAEGATAGAARQKAAATASRMINAAQEIRRESQDVYKLAEETVGPRRPRKITAVILQDAVDDLDPGVAPPSLGRVLTNILYFVMAPTVRLVIGLALLAGCLLWMYQNGLISRAQDIQSTSDAWELAQARDAEPLRLNSLKLPFGGYGAAVAGMLMLIAAFLPNWKAIILMPLGALVAWLGPQLGVPAIGPLTASQLSMAVGGCVGLLGILLGRRS